MNVATKLVFAFQATCVKRILQLKQNVHGNTGNLLTCIPGRVLISSGVACRQDSTMKSGVT